jgi:hypothetical protein
MTFDDEAIHESNIWIADHTHDVDILKGISKKKGELVHRLLSSILNILLTEADDLF